MPGWQSLYQQHQDENFELLTVAMDVQGADAARPWVEKADAAYPALVDAQNKLGNQFQYNYVPLVIFFDEEGHRMLGPRGFNIGKSEDKQLVLRWIQGKSLDLASMEKESAGSEGSEMQQPEAALRFQYANYLLKEGRKEASVDQLKQALKHDADNWIIHKQIWAIEHPEKFYDGDVDFGWQKEQLEKEGSK